MIFICKNWQLLELCCFSLSEVEDLPNGFFYTVFSNLVSLRCGRSNVPFNFAAEDTLYTWEWRWVDFQLSLYCCKILTLWKITFCVADDHLSVQVDESGWAWLVHKERLIIWKIGQSPLAKVNERPRWKMCKFELVGQVTRLCCFKSSLLCNLKFASFPPTAAFDMTSHKQQ